MNKTRLLNSPVAETASHWDRRPPIAVFWDQSLVWGLILLETLDLLEIPYHLLTSRDVRNEIGRAHV